MPDTPPNGSRSIKRERRSKGDLRVLENKIAEVLAEEPEQTVRQVYYRLTTLGALEKTKLAYRVVVRLLTQLRKRNEVKHTSISDTTRWVRCPLCYADLGQAVDALRSQYSLDLGRHNRTTWRCGSKRTRWQASCTGRPRDGRSRCSRREATRA